MKSTKYLTRKITAMLLSLILTMSAVTALSMTVSAVEGTTISYSFSGTDKDTAGYAQGTVTLSSDTAGTYHLYWSDDTKALDGYYEIASVTVSAGGSGTYKFEEHTAIPKNATKIIATTTSDKTVSNAKAVYTLPVSKRLDSGSGKLLYTFNSYSDVHIDLQGYYTNASKNWAQALKFGVDKDTDFIVSSGDMVTNAAGPDSEWDEYEKILAESDYVNPVWESDGNHDMRTGVDTGLTSFVRASGTDSTIANYDANKPYYYVTEQTTGDIFIFMALEKSSNPSSCDEFTSAQMTWLTNLLSKYYGTGVNIYIIEHSPIKGFGAGDRMSNPYYKAHLSEEYTSTVQFKALLQKYPNLIWMSGHTHEDFEMGYNYSDENDTACHMIHNPAVAGSTWASGSDTSLDYNNGVGRNSQGYYVETYENQVVYYGANLTDEMIYPAYTYIMEGSRTLETTQPQVSSTATETTSVGTLGDVNSDNNINVKDATLIQKKCASLETFSDAQCKVADVNGDGNVNIKDATLIQKYCASLISGFTANQSSDKDSQNELSANTVSQKSEVNAVSANAVSQKSVVNEVSANTLTQELALVKAQLDAKYTFSSYDQYQALKKYYYQYKGQTTADSSVITEFENLIADLNEIAEHIGAPVIYTVGDTYYFENTYDWSSVYCYAWKGSSNNASWPGVTMQKVGKNGYHDVYGIKFEYAGQYTSLIFNNGKDQTVDIILNTFEGNCFYLDGGTDSSGKITVGDFTFSGGTTPTVATNTTQNVSDNKRYALKYYNGTAHDWNATDTFFTPQSDGTYVLDFVATNSDNISLKVYDNSSGTYNCVSDSTSFTYSVGTVNTYSLVGPVSTGSSITIKGMSTGATLKFVYNPTSNTLQVTCVVINVEPTEATSSSSSNSSGTVYTLYMVPYQSYINSGYTFKANIKDSSSAYHQYTLEKTGKTYNGVAVYKVEIANPAYTNVIKIQYQSWNGTEFVGQVVDERTTTLSYYDKKIMVCSSGTTGTLQAYSG